MGCQPDKPRLPISPLFLARTQIPSLDLFYIRTEVTVLNVRTLSKSIESLLDQFATTTGLDDPPYRSPTFGLISLLISVLASADGNVSSLDLYIYDKVPGIVLEKAALDECQLAAYEGWLELLYFLDAAVPLLTSLCPQMAQHIRESRDLLCHLDSLPEARDMTTKELSVLTKTVSSNSVAIQRSSHQLQWVVFKVRETLQEIATVVNELGKMEDLSKLIELSERAKEKGLTTPRSILSELGFELDELIRHQKRLITGGQV